MSRKNPLSSDSERERSIAMHGFCARPLLLCPSTVTDRKTAIEEATSFLFADQTAATKKRIQ